jgi:hypothetical protein
LNVDLELVNVTGGSHDYREQASLVQGHLTFLVWT